jgi:hypothetical protein
MDGPYLTSASIALSRLNPISTSVVMELSSGGASGSADGG